MTAGYSGTPLAMKLGLKPGMRVFFEAMPDSVYDEIVAERPDLSLDFEDVAQFDAVHFFTVKRVDLEERLDMWRRQIAPAGFIWVSWPKKASKLPTDITEDVIREICLPMGLVDVKVCAIDDVWSGLKLVIRRELRG